MTHITDPRDILIAPVVSEKCYGLLDEGKYTFLVDPRRTRRRSRSPSSRSSTSRSTGPHDEPQGQAQRTRFGFGKRKDTKRAIVTLARGLPSTSSAAGRLTGPEETGTDTWLSASTSRPPRAVVARPSPTSSRSLGPTPEKSLVRPLTRSGGRNNARPDHHPPHRWRPQARLPRHRLPSPRQGRRAGQGRAHRVRPQPHRADRAAALRRRREALHPRAEPAEAGRHASRTVRRPTSSRATACRCATSRRVPPCTPSS